MGILFVKTGGERERGRELFCRGNESDFFFTRLVI